MVDGRLEFGSENCGSKIWPCQDKKRIEEEAHSACNICGESYKVTRNRMLRGVPKEETIEKLVSQNGDETTNKYQNGKLGNVSLFDP